MTAGLCPCPGEGFEDCPRNADETGQVLTDIWRSRASLTGLRFSPRHTRADSDGSRTSARARFAMGDESAVRTFIRHFRRILRENNARAGHGTRGAAGGKVSQIGEVSAAVTRVTPRRASVVGALANHGNNFFLSVVASSGFEIARSGLQLRWSHSLRNDCGVKFMCS